MKGCKQRSYFFLTCWRVKGIDGSIADEGVVVSDGCTKIVGDGTCVGISDGAGVGSQGFCVIVGSSVISPSDGSISEVGVPDSSASVTDGWSVVGVIDGLVPGVPGFMFSCLSIKRISL